MSNYLRDLTPDELLENYTKLQNKITDTFSENRAARINKMYDHFGARMMTAPASMRSAWHNTFPGGYVLHILHVIDMAEQLHELYIKNEGYINYTPEELVFACAHHDLGKLGDLEHDYYIPQTSDWHVKNKGELYQINPKLQLMNITDRSLWLLQYFGIKVTISETLGIKLADGLYELANEKYLKQYDTKYQLKHSLPYIVHWADFMATRLERDQWIKKLVEPKPIKKRVEPDKPNLSSKQPFEDLFKEEE